MARILMLCDWLPPDFGAVGQYAVGFAKELAAAGNDVTLVGFSSRESSEVGGAEGAGRLTIRKIRRPIYDRANFLLRAAWTLGANLALLWGSRKELRSADEVRFTGSPPYMLHFVMPAARLFGVRTRYRITDFHPECMVAAMEREPWWLRAIGWKTWFWRRRVDVIEVLGEDQRRRLLAGGVAPDHIELRRDPAPVAFAPGLCAAPIPDRLAGRKVVLYSGNWGVPHDTQTFVEGFARFCRAHPASAGMWLNATGRGAEVVAAELERLDLPLSRTRLVPLDELPSVLMAADLHLIALKDAFVGYVLPSKVYACIDSGKPILFVGSEQSDVHLVCSERVPASKYRRVDVGDADGVARALSDLLLPGNAGE